MSYCWTQHALDRLSQRTSLRWQQANELLEQELYVIKDRSRTFVAVEHHHLIWDLRKAVLIDIPTIPYSSEGSFIIPTVLPVNYKSPYSESQRLEAKEVWERFFTMAP